MNNKNQKKEKKFIRIVNYMFGIYYAKTNYRYIQNRCVIY